MPKAFKSCAKSKKIAQSGHTGQIQPSQIGDQPKYSDTFHNKVSKYSLLWASLFLISIDNVYSIDDVRQPLVKWSIVWQDFQREQKRMASYTCLSSN